LPKLRAVRNVREYDALGYSGNLAKTFGTTFFTR
jgi:hypothetical protein